MIPMVASSVTIRFVAPSNWHGSGSGMAVGMVWQWYWCASCSATVWRSYCHVSGSYMALAVAVFCQWQQYGIDGGMAVYKTRVDP